MSRVTKLRKQYRAQRHAKARRVLEALFKSARVRNQTPGARNYLSEPYRLTRRDRREARGRSQSTCSCGHRLHGKFGCLRGCAWQDCNVVHFEPITPSPIDYEFQVLSDQRVRDVLGVFALTRI